MQQLQHTLIGRVALVEKVNDHHIEPLAVAMAAANALFHTLRVPGQVVVDNEGAELQVHALGCGFGGNEDFRLLAEMVNERGAAVNGWGARHTVTAGVLSQPALVDAGGRRALVAAAEQCDFARVAVGFEVAGQIVLRATGLREDHRLAGRTHGAHALKALLQRRQQRVGLLVFADVAGQSQVAVQLGQFLAHQGVVHRRRAVGLGRNRVALFQQVFVEVFVFNQLLNPLFVDGLLVQQALQPGANCIQRGHHGLSGRGQQLAQDEPHQVLLAAGEAVAEIALQVGRDQLVKLDFLF